MVSQHASFAASLDDHMAAEEQGAQAGGGCAGAVVAARADVVAARAEFRPVALVQADGPRTSPLPRRIAFGGFEYESGDFECLHGLGGSSQ